jgi:hypothetical protein
MSLAAAPLALATMTYRAAIACAVAYGEPVEMHLTCASRRSIRLPSLPFLPGPTPNEERLTRLTYDLVRTLSSRHLIKG